MFTNTYLCPQTHVAAVVVVVVVGVVAAVIVVVDFTIGEGARTEALFTFSSGPNSSQGQYLCSVRAAVDSQRW